MIEEIIIRPAESTDVDQIAAIEQQLFSEPWSASSLEEARRREDNVFLVASCENQVVAYVLLYGVMEEGEISTIATKPTHTKKGIGTKLLKALLQECKVRGIQQVFLEVRESNENAQNLYRKCDFIEVGKRKNFYRFPEEDALVMMCQVQGQQ